jgi:hypothetical protein
MRDWGGGEEDVEVGTRSEFCGESEEPKESVVCVGEREGFSRGTMAAKGSAGF